MSFYCPRGVEEVERMPEIILRNLTKDDFEKVCQFRREGHFTAIEEGDDEQIEKTFDDVLKKKQAWVAEVDSRPIGCACLDHKNWIHISVMPEFRRKGFGKQILEMIPIRGAAVWARIPNTNVAAIRLFRSADYKDYDFTNAFVIMQRNY